MKQDRRQEPLGPSRTKPGYENLALLARESADRSLERLSEALASARRVRVVLLEPRSNVMAGALELALAALHTSRRAADSALLEMLELGDLALDAHAESARRVR